MSENGKEKSKGKIIKKINTFDNNSDKLFSKKPKMFINLSSTDNNEIELFQKKFFSDKIITNEKKKNSLLLETENDKIKNEKFEENINNNIHNDLNIEKENENVNKDIKNIENEKENQIDNKNEEEINKEKELHEEKEINEEKKINEEKEKEIVNEVNQNVNNEKEILNENDILLNIDKTNLEIMQEKNNELQNKLKDLLLEFKKEENDMNKLKNECNNKITKLNSKIKKQANVNKKAINNITELQNELNNAYDRLLKYFTKNKNNFFNQSKNKIEKQLKIKESQYNLNQKVTMLLMKEINKYNRKLKLNTNIDENIKQENPSIKKKEEEYRFILNKLNEEIDILKQDIQALKFIRTKHQMCSKTEKKLIKEIEFYKVEKQKKLDYIVSLNKFKYFQKLRKRKVFIEKEQFNNLSTNDLKTNLKNPLEPIKIENDLINYESEVKNEISPIIPMKKIIKLKNINHLLNASKSTKNIYEKAKQYELDKKEAEKSKEKKITLKEKFKENSFSNFRIIPNKLFTDEEKSIFKNYKFIPDEEVDNCEKKYNIKLREISKTEREIKKLSKQNAKKIINIKCKIVGNEKKQKSLEKIGITSSVIIKENANKILKLKSLIKQKLLEGKKLDMDLRKENMKHEKLKEILHASNNFGNVNSTEKNKEQQNNDNDNNDNKIIESNINNEQNINQISNNENESIEKNNDDNKDNIN